MNNFEKQIEKMRSEAREQRRNINIGVMALLNIYNNLSEEQKQDVQIIESFMIVLNNL